MATTKNTVTVDRIVKRNVIDTSVLDVHRNKVKTASKNVSVKLDFCVANIMNDVSKKNHLIAVENIYLNLAGFDKFN